MKLVILFLVIGLVKTQDSKDLSDLRSSNDDSGSSDAGTDPSRPSTTRKINAREQSTNRRINAPEQSSTRRINAREQSTNRRINAREQSTTRRINSREQSTNRRTNSREQPTTRRINAREQSTNRRNNVVGTWNNRQTRNLGQAASRSQTGARAIIRPGSSVGNNAMRRSGFRIRGQDNNRNTNRLTQTNTNRLTHSNTFRSGRTNRRQAGRNIATRLPRPDFRGRTRPSWNRPGIGRTTLNRRPNWQSNRRFSTMRRQPFRQNSRQRARNTSRNSSLRRRQSSRTSPFNARSRFGTRRSMTTDGSLFTRIVVRQTSPPYRLVYRYVPV
ncbi:uncharacterized protein LOC127735536 isoform X2 [Mytilus californianus]|uniref:uncharacterized protein LOC127735536 isoform X2 n=1 Tax=Mytilus californianus TaxID=6549 RepID=UPI002244FF62|nr:uncharacterized protein LOC127735536 isoform X2 [Mytilus californianus]